MPLLTNKWSFCCVHHSRDSQYSLIGRTTPINCPFVWVISTLSRKMCRIYAEPCTCLSWNVLEILTEQEAPLSQRNPATRYVSKFEQVHAVSRGMRVRKVSNSKSGLQGHSRALAMVSFDKQHTISYQCFIATMSPSCAVSEILPLISQNLKVSRDSEHISYAGNISCVH